MRKVIHPASWWFFAICLVVAASIRTEWFIELGIIALALILIVFFRQSSLWLKSLRFYLGLGAFVVSVRVLFRIIFSSGFTAGNVAFELPTLRLGSVDLLGPVGVDTLQAAATDGLRLAAIIIAIGMANTLAAPKRLLKSTPGALYEVATAMTVAINLAPQLIESLQRVRRARALRGRSKGIRALPSIVIPALEDTIEQSLALAASMDARGFGRQGSLSSAERFGSRVLSLGGLLALACSTYFFMATSQTGLAFTLASLGLISLAVTIRIAAKRNLRTRYQPQKLKANDFLIGLAGIAAAALAVSL